MQLMQIPHASAAVITLQNSFRSDKWRYIVVAPGIWLLNDEKVVLAPGGLGDNMKQIAHANFPVGKAALQSTVKQSASRTSHRVHRPVVAEASKGNTQRATKHETRKTDKRNPLGDVLGPIGLTIGGQLDKQSEADRSNGAQSGNGSAEGSNGAARNRAAGNIELGPIALSFADDRDKPSDRDGDDAAMQSWDYESIHSMTTEEWRRRYEQDGAVDLWVEEEFNSGSRLVGGRDAHRGQAPGFGSGEGPSAGTAPVHTIRILNRAAGQEIEVEVPEDRYVLHEAEDQGLLLPWACRMGCCTACAVRVLEGHLHQPQALGISASLREQGFALMCTAFPRSDAVLECIEEDEVYDMQFGEAFEAMATNPNDKRNVLRDDYALEIADMDE